MAAQKRARSRQFSAKRTDDLTPYNVGHVPLDQLSVLKLVTSRLDAHSIAYMTTGSIAAGHYAQPRMTRDIDLVLVLSKLVWANETGSELQLRDLRQLVAAQPDLDWVYVVRWGHELGVSALVEEVRR
jgi:hypothetical protein